jgi:hypothetical protein
MSDQIEVFVSHKLYLLQYLHSFIVTLLLLSRAIQADQLFIQILNTIVNLLLRQIEEVCWIY